MLMGLAGAQGELGPTRTELPRRKRSFYVRRRADTDGWRQCRARVSATSVSRKASAGGVVSDGDGNIPGSSNDMASELAVLRTKPCS